MNTVAPTPEGPTRQRAAYACALTAVLLWSTVASAFKLSLRRLSFVELLMFSSLVSTVLLGVVVLATGRWKDVARGSLRQWGRSCLMGLVNPFVYYLVLFKAYELLPAQQAQPINYTWALTLAVLSVPLLGQHRQGRKPHFPVALPVPGVHSLLRGRDDSNLHHGRAGVHPWGAVDSKEIRSMAQSPQTHGPDEVTTDSLLLQEKDIMNYRDSISRSRIAASVLLLACLTGVTSPAIAVERGYSIPVIDLSQEKARQVVVDREPGQYLGHVTTVLLEDGKTMLCVYPKGHGKGAIVMKRSTDGGKTWSDRLPTPENWKTSKEVPTIHRTVDAGGKKRLILWSGFYPARLAVSESDGQTWTGLKPVGDWGGVVVMGFVEPLKTGKGHYLAMFHDSGRYFQAEPKKTRVSTIYKTLSTDGGLTWSFPETVWQGTDAHLCEPGCIRSPNGRQLAVLLRENSRRRNSHVIFSNDEGKTWTQPRELPGALTGDRHTGKYAPDGRLFISFRDTTLESPTKGDWVGWVGTYDDIVKGREGQYRVRLMNNRHRWDCAYPGVEVLPDGTFVATTYGHWKKREKPYIVSVRFTLAELDKKAAELRKKKDSLPSRVDLRGRLDQWGLGPRSQGKRPTCSVFTVAAALEYALARQRGKGIELSVEYLNWAANHIVGNQTAGDGEFFHNLFHGFDEYGVCTEKEMPYRGKFDPSLEPSKALQDQALGIHEARLRIHWIKELWPSKRLTEDQFIEIKKVLAQGWPVGAGASHSRLLVGYHDDPEKPGGGVFLTKDSGAGGYRKVTYEFVRQKVGDVFWIEGR